ncbi:MULTISPECIES: hypothetical protein [unclassified Nitratiruptor]|uniref:hypothetical protein n=1 Tax=unclassified Nitratiruptor TaxID=2624044 RepID=UPI0019162C43|nr:MULTISPECIES: hypothetical protein [unclassified Nitratiruptor]
MKCKVCRKGELFYLFGWGLMVTAFNAFTVGCVQLTSGGAYGMMIAGTAIMIFGAYLKSR